MDCIEQIMNQISKWFFILIVILVMAVMLGCMFIPFVVVAYLVQKYGSTKSLAIDGSPPPMQSPKTSSIKLEWITRILRWIVILTLGWMVVSCCKFFNAQDGIDDIAKSLVIGGSPFVIQLPNSLFVNPSVTIDIGRYDDLFTGTGIGQCSHIRTSFKLINLNNGLLDLTPYIESFKECDFVRIRIRGGYLTECFLDVKYADAKIISMDTHCID